jgi:hypothetical protein
VKHWLLDFLIRRRRVWAMVDFYGDIQMYRAFPFHRELHNPTGWTRNLPNLFVHFYPGEPGGAGPDSAVPHSHPWSSLGFIVRGAYEEIVHEHEVRENKAPALTFVSYKTVHRLLSVKPGTISLFFHGFRRKKHWIQYHPDKAVPFSHDRDTGVFTKKMVTTLIRVDEDFDRKIAQRKALIARLFGDSVPVTNAEKIRRLKEVMP